MARVPGLRRRDPGLAAACPRRKERAPAPACRGASLVGWGIVPPSAPRLVGWGLTLLPLLLAGCRGPGPFRVEENLQAEGPGALRAGVATRVFTPLPGYPLGGYGGGARRAEFPFALGLGWYGRLALAAHLAWHREGDEPADLLVPNRGVHDPLSARALVLRPEGQPPLALVRLDAIGCTAELHARVVAALEDLGYRPDRVVLAATHTHSGPGSFMRAPFACLVAMDVFRPEVEEALARACVEAVRAAHEAARPAAIGFGAVRDRGPDGLPRIAKNRRHRRFRGEIPLDAIDDEVGFLRVDDLETGRPLALVVNYAVHPTVLGSDNLEFSADLAGGIERALGARVGAPVLFFNGAEGDVGPRRIEAPHGHERIAELGEAFADLVAPAVASVETHPRVEVSSAWGSKELGRPYTQVALGRERFLDGDRGPWAWLGAPLALPVNAVLWALGLTNVRVAIPWTFALGVVLELDALVPRTRTRFLGLRLRAGPEEVALLTVPGEPTHDVGLEIKERARRAGARRAFVVGLALDHIGYVASRREYRRGGYEAWSTLFGEGTAGQVLAAADALLEALGFEEGSAALGKK
ncbi:MAG: hypothetical protein D6731_04805 [Planctomycetota bacterium]|nr:MAG: hypothetical protein D6731_04805 [Planctomycetota bacterium]